MPYSLPTNAQILIYVNKLPKPRSHSLLYKGKMGGGDVLYRRPSYLTSCMSPSCVPVHEDYSRITPSLDKGCGLRNRRLRKLLRKIVNESKITIMGQHKPQNFQYDALSYSQNFDDGCHRDEKIFALSTSISRF